MHPDATNMFKRFTISIILGELTLLFLPVKIDIRKPFIFLTFQYREKAQRPKHLQIQTQFVSVHICVLSPLKSQLIINSEWSSALRVCCSGASNKDSTAKSISSNTWITWHTHTWLYRMFAKHAYLKPSETNIGAGSVNVSKHSASSFEIHSFMNESEQLCNLVEKMHLILYPSTMHQDKKCI